MQGPASVFTDRKLTAAEVRFRLPTQRQALVVKSVLATVRYNMCTPIGLADPAVL